MRLKKIKLAGFKSFVDPTSIPFPSNLVAVVGPNGCGKSNIIDAVRWVMGESSAKQLRGEALTDVIFNGSSHRKPVGQASIELVFDNSDGKLGGQYADYAEISVRRQVNREAQSAYFLNGAKCRRRDIVDVFLGTGLGPRSYAIIEQGMISRFIEAKPDELRVYLEEAAGISKYRERRRETENRMRHTRDNLSRLTDLRDELGKQLEKLQRQAKAAERYKEYKEEERRLTLQLQTCQWRSLADQLKQQDFTITEQENTLQQHKASQQHVITQAEKSRVELHDLNDTLQQVQERYYNVGAEIAKIEQQLSHQQELQQKLSYDQQQVETSWQQAQQHLSSDQTRLDELTKQLDIYTPQLGQLKSAAQAAQTTLHQAEDDMQAWQTQWDAFSDKSASTSKQAEVEKTRIEHLAESQTDIKERIHVISQQQQKIDNSQLQQDLHTVAKETQQQKASLEQINTELTETNKTIGQLRERNKDVNDKLDTAKNRLQQLHSRYATTNALQQAALGKQDDKFAEWLNKHELTQAPRLAECIEVDSEWQQATETVLHTTLKAVCIDSFSEFSERIDQGVVQMPDGELTILNTKALSQAKPSSHSKPTLADKVKAPWQTAALLGQVYLADNLSMANQMLADLAPHESVVTKSGIWLSKHWLRSHKASNDEASILKRKQTLKSLQQDLNQQEQTVKTLEAEQQDTKERLAIQENKREEVLQQQTHVTQQLSKLQAQHDVKQQTIEQAQARSEALRQELTELSRQLSATEGKLSTAKVTFQQASESAETQTTTREDLLSQRDDLLQQLNQARQTNQKNQAVAHETELKVQAYSSELSTKQQAIHRSKEQLSSLSTQRDSLKDKLAVAGEPIAELKQQLDSFLDKRLHTEDELHEAKEQVKTCEQTLQELESQRNQHDEDLQTSRQMLETLRVSRQTIQVKRDALVEQIEAAGYQVQVLLEELPDDINEAELHEQLDVTAKRISRLGAINLAALDELEQLNERKTYLDAQHADLIEALETLESAIRKIDKETRTRFKDTYDHINHQFTTLFPKIFGGGSAGLDMTSDDLLETGIMVRAQPPGKRNSTIHLLSGGEKALTAVALVFAFFSLNPAPFCMLDEVDAPLDDANVLRYCNLVKEMSKSIQFIFITHNKLAMEMSSHLMGITMKEPGVSRIVSVDVEKALEMAEA